MAPQHWALRCCRCRLFQAKRSGKWSCSVCGQRQAVQKLYGQGSALDCRRHVQKLNLLQGEAEEAIGWTSRCVEDSVNDSKNTAAQHEDSLVQQEGRAEVSRWSKYLDKDNEDQEDGEEEAGTERQQFCSRRKNTAKEQRKHQKSFLSSDAQEYAEEDEVSQIAYRAKKHKKCLVAVPDQDDGDAVCGHSMVPAVCESIVPEENTPTPTACTKPSKWQKFLSHSGNCSENAARITLSPQEGGGRLGLHSTTAADAGMASRCSEQAQRTLPPGTAFEFKKCVASTEQLSSKLPGTMVPSTGCSAGEGVLFREPQSQMMRAGSGVIDTTAGRCCSDSTRANTFVNCNTGPKPSIISCERLFCTGDEFDDDL
ncbi:MRN complex-interacting protein isoform X2 [Strigops habroptila]|uniref:MRN complex-interacting protein isoform X2 n=1 Tax=Strigops habroptila TaxID=2489341 RepID=UPI0011CF37D2|nr:MRN complex-interacting protein isoform X2 [Strigops habroptila]